MSHTHTHTQQQDEQQRQESMVDEEEAIMDNEGD